MNATLTESRIRSGKEDDKIRVVFLQFWYEYAVFNADDLDGAAVVAQGQQSGKYYILTLDDTGHVINAELY